MKLDPTVRRNRLLDRQARQLVAELDRAALRTEPPGAQAVVQGGQVIARDRFQQPQLEPRRHHRRGLQHPARRRRKVRGPGQHGAADGVGNIHVHRRQRLGDEEGVPAGPLVEPISIGIGRRRQRPDRPSRQRRDVNALDRAHPGQLAEHDLQRGGGTQVIVSERDQRQQRQRLDPAREQLDHVQRPDVGPMHVLDHEHGRRPARELTRQRAEQLVGRPSMGPEPGELDAGGVGDLEERPERPRREQPLADHPQHAGG